MISLALFGISLVLLIALFGCKTLELRQNVWTPLKSIRRFGDPLVEESFAKVSRASRTYSTTTTRATLKWCKALLRSIHRSFDRSLHVFALELNRYLRGRGAKRGEESDISAHLKTVLEKTEEVSDDSVPK